MRPASALLLVWLLLAPGLWAAGENLFVFSPGGKYVTKVTPAGRSALVSVRNAQDLTEVASWEVANFKPHSVEYDPNDPNRLLLAGPEKLIVYQLDQGQPNRVFEKQADEGQEITKANFAPDRKDVYWSYNQSIHRAGPDGTEHQIDYLDEPVKDISPLKDRQVAVAAEGEEGLLVYNEATEAEPRQLEGHKAPVVGVESPGGQRLYSLDETNQLFEWDLLKDRPRKGFALEPGKAPNKALALALDDQKQRLYVLKEENGKQVIDSYGLVDLDNQKILPKREALVSTKAQQIYNGYQALTGEELRPTPPPPSRPFSNQPKGPYDLAKIEAQNGNLQEALRYIEQVSPSDPNFAASRQLQREVYRKGEVHQDLNAAKEQYHAGNYRSAEILLENVLAKDPKQAEAKRYMDLTEDKLFANQAGAWGLALVILGLLGLGGWLLYERREQAKRLFAGVFKNDSKERRRLILRLAKARELLARRRGQDKMGYYHGRLGEIERQLDWVNERLSKPDASIKELLILVGRLHQEMLEMVKGAKKSAQQEAPKEEAQAKAKEQKSNGEQEARQKNEEAQKRRQKAEEQARAQQKKAQEEQAKAQTEADRSGDPKGYFKVLGVPPDASQEMIKKAYRNKIKEYHPDKHSASGFEWVKEEAEKMTRQVQEAYGTLKDPKARARYQQG